MLSLISKDWLLHFKEQIKNAQKIRIISPFITNVMVTHLIDNYCDAEVEVITRYNLNDFRSRASSISALKRLVMKGFKVRGIKGLHSKLYAFDNRCAIISSANFTGGGFFNNYELGIKTFDQKIVNQAIIYFEGLFNVNIENLNLETIEIWEDKIKKEKPIYKPTEDLPDYGTSPFRKQNINQKYFIKFFGRSDSRANKEFTTQDMVEGSHCHFAVTFSGRKGRPRKYNDGDIIYLATMLSNREYAIFGKATAIKHNDLRDMASEEDISHVKWKEHYGVYIRIKDPVFIDGKMGDCPMMSNLIDDLKYEAFFRTNMRYIVGGKKTNPWDSLRQQADVQLSELGAQWLDNKFLETINTKGSIKKEFIDGLYKSQIF
ncbi:phospholipase D family protein [Pedobacter cryotolerans]|uniref:NgoFVII family restriction endonuclease n=1 Tax=Pedobacter cryotolerans TaxID=2571270 RepID=A0A4U1C622_9SPHI|nr:phospholipase D family protein [Pedobacter cryotolerans]TKC01402.1 NgoFVII family restriction endonuclease [Pedobacter cryotolerans]